jgi:hypothetical protein
MIKLDPINTNAPYVIFLIILFIFGLARQLEGDRLQLFFRSFLNTNLVDQQLRQERAFSRLAIFLFILVMMIIATYLTLYFHEIDLFLDFSFIGLFTGVIVSLAILTTFRVALYSLLAWLFNLEALQQHHTFHWLLTNVVLCSIILTVSIVGFYGPTIIQSVFLQAGFWVIITFYVIRILRIAYISSTDFRVPLAYNFLYICALEILPLLVIATVISRQFVG